jgi:hypothetical protein
VAKSRQIGSPTIDFRFIAFHSSAQACMRSRDARGSRGGGTDVSSGGSGGSALGAAGAGALRDGGGDVGVGARGFTAVAPGDGGDDCAGCEASGFGRAGFVAGWALGAEDLVLDGATRGAGGVACCCATAGASAKAQAPAIMLATMRTGDGRSRAATIILFPARAKHARFEYIAGPHAGVER